ncbi:hypothetical protein ACFLZV_07325 [Candidatus Margulisiibacteriota bacterium]
MNNKISNMKKIVSVYKKLSEKELVKIRETRKMILTGKSEYS